MAKAKAKVMKILHQVVVPLRASNHLNILIDWVIHLSSRAMVLVNSQLVPLSTSQRRIQAK